VGELLTHLLDRADHGGVGEHVANRLRLVAAACLGYVNVVDLLSHVDFQDRVYEERRWPAMPHRLRRLVTLRRRVGIHVHKR
jgi:hypothetical protein